MTSDLKILPRKPSKDLLDLIDEVGKLGRKLSDLLERIKQKGIEEGFNDEVKQLLKDKLKGVLTRNQIKYYLYCRERLTLQRVLGEKTHIEGKKDIEKKSRELKQQLTINQQSNTEAQDFHVQKPEMDGKNVDPIILALRATVEDQAKYINTLEEKIQENYEIQENQEIQRAQHQLRIRVSISQLYRDVFMVQNSGAIYVDILIDSNNKYQMLKAV